MKKAIVSLLVILGFSMSNLQAQTPAGYEKGSIILADNSKQDGLIKESLNAKGTVSFMTSAGSKKTYTVAELNGFSYKNDIYIAYTNDFYKAITIGSKASLYQKQTNNAGKLLYNGSDAYTATTTEGNIGDYYIQINKSDDLLLVNAKNFSALLSKSFADCSAVVAEITAKQLDYAQLTKAVEKYNSCK